MVNALASIDPGLVALWTNLYMTEQVKLALVVFVPGKPFQPSLFCYSLPE
jgi:hypothetical protein